MDALKLFAFGGFFYRTFNFMLLGFLPFFFKMHKNIVWHFCFQSF